MSGAHFSQTNAVTIPEKIEKISMGARSFIVPLPKYKLHKKICTNELAAEPSMEIP